ncbi:unnamed protein product [Prorocentrum cordatum]|uniref:Fanconi-associated nuclease n=1 Tax=Prorocentrum cordatum TaxID=2364126 RepID=A0ABN9TLC1_9DINO|nr:unnamed protein product [Polarella glacialis]
MPAEHGAPDARTGRAWHAAARLGLLSCGLFGPRPTAVVPLTAPPPDSPLWQPLAPARRRDVAAAAHIAPSPLDASSASSGRRPQDVPHAGGPDGLSAWEKIVTGAPPAGPFSGWRGALEGQGGKRIGAARAVHYVIDPADPRTGKLGRRLRRRLGLSVWRDFAMDLFRSNDLQHWSKGTWKKLEQEEKHLARELGCIEVLMGPILEAEPDADADGSAGGARLRGKLLGGFKVYCVPSAMALAGGFIDRLGEWWPLRDGTLRVWEQLEESGVELAEMESAPLTMQTLFSETPGLEDYDPVSSAAFAERVSKIVVASPRVARRAGKKQTEREAKLAREVLRQMRSDDFTPEVVEKVYREVDRRLPRSGRHGLLPNLHTRNVYNMVADVRGGGYSHRRRPISSLTCCGTPPSPGSWCRSTCDFAM